jgi:TonB family protein
MAYVELGQDNGGILLNLGEGGFAVQSALAFQAIEFPELRFQIPQRRGWQTARGRIAWMSENKTVAGIQFLELPEATRREIRNWIAAKENGEPAIGKEDVEPQRNISATTYRGDPRIQAARKANPEKPPRSPGSNQGSRRVANPAPASATQIGSQATGAIGTTAEAPEQDFRFNDYSMFAAVPSREEVWGDGGRQKRSSQRLALASILIAALFFILGATIGRGTVDHWIAYVGTWMQGPTAPSVKPPAPVDQSSSAVPDRSEISQRDGSGAGGNQTGDAGQTQNETPATNPAAAAHATSATGESHAEPRERATAEVSSEAKTSVRGDEMGAVATTPMATPAPKQPTKAGASRSSYSASEGESPHVGEHSILVNAPEPGNPPFIVNLPSDAISASSTVAISARRSMQVLPRAGQPGSHSERVVIGRLISHSEPFYPVEARYRRLEGGVEVHATIGRTGQVISVRSVSGPTLLASAAMTAVREWRYEPTFIDGDPVETQAEITMVFRLP